MQPFLKRMDVLPEIKLSYHPTKIQATRLNDLDSQVNFVKSLFNPDTFFLQEECIVLIMDASFFPIGYYHLAKGTSEEVPIDYRLLMQVLILSGCSKFILAHNHPSGVSIPSENDVISAHAIKLRAGMFGIDLVDDLVVSSLEDGDTGYCSLYDMGLLF